MLLSDVSVKRPVFATVVNVLLIVLLLLSQYFRYESFRILMRLW